MVDIKTLSLISVTALVVTAKSFTEIKPFACETTGGSPLLKDCYQLARDYICVENNCHTIPSYNNNDGGSHCTTLSSRGTCAASLCGDVGRINQGEMGAVLFGILSSCTDGTRVGGKTDILNFADSKMTVEFIGSGKSSKRKRKILDESMFTNPAASFNVTKRDTVRGAIQYQVPGTPYTMEIIGARNTGERLEDSQANSLTNNVMNSYNGRHTADRTVHGSVGTWDGFADITYYMNPVDNYLGDIGEPHFRDLTQALQDFRNNQNNPGWFTVAVYSPGALLGVMNFQLADFA
jgi:hypothetical protein